jgi:hypothetical protein
MSNTTHVITIKFVSTGANTITKPLTDVNKGTQTLTKSNMDLTKAQNQQVPILAKLKTGYTASGQAQNTVLASSNKLSATLPKQSSGQNEVATTANQMAGAQNKAGTSMGGLTEKFTKFRPLIFGGTGIVTAGIEAVGMWGMYSSASEKVAVAQETVNMLIAAGQQDTAEYTQATNDLTDAKRSQNFALRIMILSFSDLAPMILLSLNAVLNMRKAFAEGKVATDALASSSTNLANVKKTSLIPTLSNFNLELGKTPKMQDAVSNGMNMMGKNTKSFFTPLKELGSRFKQTFSGISIEVGKTDGLWNKMKAGFSALGTALIGGLKGIGTGFKAAGAAALAFSKTLIGVFTRNPILLLITAIATAIGALIFDLGGFRTALNNVGITLGKMAPWAKPFLDILGGVSKGLEGIGGSIMHMLGLGDATKKAGMEAQAAANKFDPLLLSMQKVLDVGQNFEKLSVVRTAIANVTTEITKMGTETEKGSNIMQGSIGNVANSFEIMKSQVTTTSADVVAAENAMDAAIRTVETTTMSKDAATKLLNDTYQKYLAAIQGARAEEESQIEMHNQNVIGTKSLSSEVITLSAALKDSTVVQGELAKAREADKELLEGWIRDMGLANTASNLQLKNFIDNTAAIKAFGTQVVLTDQGLVDVAGTILQIVQNNNQMGADAKEIWGTFMQQVNEVGAKYLPVIPEIIKLIRAEDEALADQLTTMYEDWIENTVEVEGKIWLVNEAEAEQSKEVDKSRESLEKKAEKLGVLADIGGKSNVVSERIIQLEGEQKKTMEETTSTLQSLAVARNADYDIVFKSDKVLRDHINSHKLNAISADEVANATTILAATREEDERASNLETMSMQKLAEEMKIGIDTTNMSAEGIQTLIQTHDDMSNALQIATDDVKTWWAELEKSQKVEEVTREELLKFAEVHKVDIPESIKKGSLQGIKDFIAQAKGMGDTAEKEAERARNAFNKLSSDASSALEGMIKEDLLKGKMDKVIDSLDEVGYSVDALSTKQAIIKVLAETQDFEDKVDSLSEIMGKEIHETELTAKNGGDAVMAEFTSGLMDTFGEDAQPIIDDINALWDQVKRENPNKTGAELLNIFLEQIGQADKVKSATQTGITQPFGDTMIQGIGNIKDMTPEMVGQIAEAINGEKNVFVDAGGNIATSVGEGAEDGSGRILPKTSNVMLKDLMSGFGFEPLKKKGAEIPEHVAEGAADGSGRILPKASNDMLKTLMSGFGNAPKDAATEGEKVPAGIAQGIKNKSGTPAEEMRNMGLTMMSQLNMMLTSQIQQTLPGFVTLFTQKFTELGNTALTFVNTVKTHFGTLPTIMTPVQTTFSNFSTSMATYMSSMGTNIATFVTNAGTNFTTLGTSLNTIWTQFSNFSMSMATYFLSMETNIATFVTNTGTQFNTLLTTYLTPLWTQFSNFSLSMATYFLSMEQNILTFVTNTSANFTLLGENLTLLWTQFSDFSTSIATYSKSMEANIAQFGKTTLVTLGEIMKQVLLTQKTFSDLSSNIATYTKSMTGNIQGFVTTSNTNLGGLSATALATGKHFGTMQTQIATATKQATAAIKSFSSSAVSALNAVTSAANKATSALNKMAAAAKKAAAAKSAAGMRFGGTIINTGNFGQHAAMGRSWIVDKPTQIAGVNVGELRKPELITVTPLTNPNDPTDKSIDPMKAAALGLGNRTNKGAGVQDIRTLGGNGGGGAGNISNNSASGMANIKIHADIHLTTTTPSGQVIKKELTSVLFNQVASITAR